MITKENIKEVLESLESEEIENAINGEEDYILLELHVFNIGAYANVLNVSYSEGEERQEDSAHNLLMDKDDFLRLFTENELSERVKDFI